MIFSTHCNLHYFMNILTPKTLSYHIPIKGYEWFKIIMADNTKYILSSYGRAKLLICIQSNGKNSTGLKLNFPSHNWWWNAFYMCNQGKYRLGFLFFPLFFLQFEYLTQNNKSHCWFAMAFQQCFPVSFQNSNN